MIEKRWYTRNGVPMVETKETRGDIVCACSNEFNDQTDIETTEQEYNDTVEAMKTAIEANLIASRAAWETKIADLEIQKAAVKTKLMAGDPLTEEEADIVLMAMP